jgi:hypothetical protein
MSDTHTLRTIEELIETLRLEKHPEGGWYREIYRSPERIAPHCLSGRHEGERCLCTHIFFLLRGNDISRFHRLQSEELWHHYQGSPLTLHTLTPQHGHTPLSLGPHTHPGAAPCVVIPAQTWFAAHCDDPDSYTLVGCTVFPGFEFSDFELARRNALVEQYPSYRALIDRFTDPQ